ncbi:MAG: patatin-like phospholipase family protein [Flavobacteriaceae bacterium]|nr:patatin-like phospholipase family protein [Flavobacteriaceae bacterium]
MKRILCLTLFFPLMFFAQKKQPTVGLVLSGGGAKGFAHISVLKEIEKSGVQIDYVAGTSMGAIVGGLYASGYSATEIETIIKKTDFFKLVQDVNPRKAKPFFEKEHGEKHILVLPINKGKVGLPQGVSKGQNVLVFLTELLSRVDYIQDFSKLPIPFFCIATDVETGKQIKLTKGSLPLALRASGSFPTLLDPIEIDSKLLIDGGVANNFPVDEMRRLGVDIIIGVDVQSKLYKKENIKSALDVLNQISSYKMYENNAEKIGLADVYIQPDIKEYTVVSFDKSKEILKRGEVAAKQFTSVFDSIAKLQVTKRKPFDLKNSDVQFSVNEIEIHGIQDYTRAYILGKLKIKVNDKLNYKEIATKIGFLSATENFTIIDYTISNLKEGKKLILNIKESPQKSIVRLGVHYDLVYKTGVLINYNQKKILSKNDALSLDLIVGDKPRYNLHYFVDNGFYYSYGFSSRYNAFSAGVKSNSPGVNEIDLSYVDFTNRAYVQTTFDRKFALGIGVEHQKLSSKTKTISTPTNEPYVFDNSNYVNSYGFLKLDTYDDKYYPTKGIYFDGRFKWYMWSSNFNNDFVQFSQIKGKIGFAKTFFNNLTVQYTSEAGFTLGEVKSKAFDFLLGGYNENFINNFVSFYGYDISELSEQTFLKSTFHFRYNFYKKQYLHVLANFARVDSSVLNGIDLFNNTKSGYALGYSINTLIGPIDVKYSWSPDTNKKYWYFNLGFWF